MKGTDSHHKIHSGKPDTGDGTGALEKKDIAFRSIFSLIEKIGTTLELEKIVRFFLATLMGQMRLRKAGIYLPDTSGARMAPYYFIGLGTDPGLPHLDMNGRLLRSLRERGGMVDLDSYARSLNDGDETRTILRSFAENGFSYALPMTEKGETIGLILISSKVVNEPVTSFDIELMLMISRVASIAIRNAWLHRKTVQAKAELENFAKVKKQFINHTSHELRTPLTVLNSAIDFIAEDVKDDSMMNMVREAINNLKEKVELLLSLNDLELQEDTNNPRILNLNSLLRECIEEVRRSIEENGVFLSLRYRNNSVKVLADYSKMKIVFRSLIDNALTYIQNGGRIEISVETSEHEPTPNEGIELHRWSADSAGTSSEEGRKTEEVTACPGEPESASGKIEFSEPPPYSVIRIRDDGIGIPEREIDSISEPFERASNSPMKNVRGMGLGLSIAQRIISSHHGKLLCRSEENRGSEFSVWLPAFRDRSGTPERLAE